MKRLILLLFAFAFLLTDVSAELKTVSFTTRDLAFMSSEAVLSKDGISISIPYDVCISSSVERSMWSQDSQGYYTSAYYISYKAETSISSVLTVSGNSIREIRWYSLGGSTYTHEFSGGVTFSNPTAGSVQSNISTSKAFPDYTAVSYSKWSGNYSGNNLQISTLAHDVSIWRVEVDYEKDVSGNAYETELEYETTIYYNPQSATELTFDRSQYLYNTLQQNGVTDFTKYGITAAGIQTSSYTSGLFTSAPTNTNGQKLTVNMQTATPMYGKFVYTVNGYYTKSTNTTVTITNTIYFVPKMIDPVITVADQQKTYSGFPQEFTISPTSTNTATALSYSNNNAGLTTVNSTTYRATDVGTYKVGISQPASGWYNPGNAVVTLSILPEDISDFWPVPVDFNKASGYSEEFVENCPLTFGDGNFAATSGANDDLDYADVSSNVRIFKYYTSGQTPANGNGTTIPTSGTYYKFSPEDNNKLLTVGIKLDKRCKFWLLDVDGSNITSRTDLGSGLETWNGVNGTVSLFTQAGHEYYFFSEGTPLSIYGYHYSANAAGYYEKHGFLTRDKNYDEE